MTASSMTVDRLVDHLEKLSAETERGRLAKLRRALSTDRLFEALPDVLPFVARNRRAEDDGLLVAGLFAHSPESGRLTLPQALSIVARKSDSVELRFLALLSASREDLGPHLRHAVALIASEGFAIDWRDLHEAIRFWDHESGRARRKWARDYWSADAGTSSEDDREKGLSR